MRTLFLQAPSFEGFDGGAGSRYQARREISSFWYPTWLAQPAALVEGSRLIDAPPHRIKLPDVATSARDYDLALLHTSAPSFAADIKAIEALKAVNSTLRAGLIGAKVAVDPEGSLKASPLIDFVARNDDFQEFAREVALQVAASDPLYVSEEEIPDDAKDAELRIFEEQAADKPEKVRPQIAEGKLRKWMEEVVLLKQEHVNKDKHAGQTIEDLRAAIAAKAGENIVIRRFARFSVGE